MGGSCSCLKFFLCLPALLAPAVAASGVRAQAIGDPKQGLALAQQTCSPCHATAAERIAPECASAEICDLAAASGMTNAALLVALTTPHAGMPMFTLTKEQRDDIIAYILSFIELMRGRRARLSPLDAAISWTCATKSRFWNTVRSS